MSIWQKEQQKLQTQCCMRKLPFSMMPLRAVVQAAVVIFTFCLLIDHCNAQGHAFVSNGSRQEPTPIKLGIVHASLWLPKPFHIREKGRAPGESGCEMILSKGLFVLRPRMQADYCSKHTCPLYWPLLAPEPCIACCVYLANAFHADLPAQVVKVHCL